MGRIKEYDRGKSRKRNRRPVIYIICEGSETEPRYFRSFRTRYCNVDIIPVVSDDMLPDGTTQSGDERNAVTGAAFYGMMDIVEEEAVLRMVCHRRRGRCNAENHLRRD